MGKTVSCGRTPRFPHWERQVRQLFTIAAILAVLLGYLPTRSAASTPTARSTANNDTRGFVKQMAEAFPDLAAAWGDKLDDDVCDNLAGIYCDAETGYLWIEPPRDMANMAGTLPELDAGIDGSQVMVDGIFFNFFPNVGGTLPASWGRLTQLLYLSLSSTGVSGTLPPEWNGMRSLEVLYVDHIFDVTPGLLTGGLPDWNLPNAQVIVLSRNQMNGTLSESWADMPQLAQVRLEGNSFSGCAPDSWKSSPVLSVTLKDMGDNGEALMSPGCAASQLPGVSPNSS